MKLHLVDGTFEIFRCFHGAPRATVGDREVGACRGLAQTMASLLRQNDVTHVAVVFDRAVAPVRVDRATEDGALQSQFGLAADVVRAMGIAVWPMIRFQADEGLASGALRFRVRDCFQVRTERRIRVDADGANRDDGQNRSQCLTYR